MMDSITFHISHSSVPMFFVLCSLFLSSLFFVLFIVLSSQSPFATTHQTTKEPTN